MAKEFVYAALTALVLLGTGFDLVGADSIALYPQQTETRQVQSLDGVWNFRLTGSEDGFKANWYQKSLDTVS